MPLIILTGYPTSGKSYRAHQLQDYFTQRIASQPAGSPASTLRVHLISDHTLSISRNVYNLESKDAHERSNNASEKDARATIYGAVKRVLSNKDVVILDGANYIKGWRYQLYCEAKALRTPHCVVHVGMPVARAREINDARLARALTPPDAAAAAEEAAPDNNSGGLRAEEEHPYERACWENLVFRYEEPNAMARWDSPLFTVLWDDATPASADIWDAVIGSDAEGATKKLVRPNQATVLKPPISGDFLHELDRTTQAIIAALLAWAKDHPGEGGGEVSVSEVDATDELIVELPSNPVGLPALQRLRRQFITLNRQNAVPVKRIRSSFVGYLNDHFQAA